MDLYGIGTDEVGACQAFLNYLRNKWSTVGPEIIEEAMNVFIVSKLERGMITRERTMLVNSFSGSLPPPVGYVMTIQVSNIPDAKFAPEGFYTSQRGEEKYGISYMFYGVFATKIENLLSFAERHHQLMGLHAEEVCKEVDSPLRRCLSLRFPSSTIKAERHGKYTHVTFYNAETYRWMAELYGTLVQMSKDPAIMSRVALKDGPQMLVDNLVQLSTRGYRISGENVNEMIDAAYLPAFDGNI